MDHSEAIAQMATERYLLDEMTEEERDAYEQHAFDCPECSVDLRVASAFLEEAKAQLPALTAGAPESVPTPVLTTPKQSAQKTDWLGWLRPFFANPLIAGPVFAALLVMVGYQNLVVMPGLREAADQPRIAPVMALHAGTRAASPVVVEASRKLGVVLAIDVPQEPAYPSYAFQLDDAQGKAALSQTIAADGAGNDGMLSLVIPGAGLRAGNYSLAVYGVSAGGQREELQRRALEVRLKN